MAKNHSHSQTDKPRTGIFSWLETEQSTTATHILESQGQVCQQARNTARYHSHSHTGEPQTGIVSRVEIQARHHSHSHPEEPRTGIFRRLETQQGTTATHILEGQEQALSAGKKYCKAPL